MDTRSPDSPPDSPSKRRRQAQRAGTRRSILEATEALLVEDGFEAFSMRRLAERCGYAAPTIYHYFGDKRGLIDELLDKRVRELMDRILRVPASTNPEENLRSYSEAFVRWGLQNPTHYRLLTGPRPEDSPEPESADELRTLFESPLRQIEARGGLATRNLEEAKQALWVLLHGLVSMRTSRPDYPWSRTLVRTALDAMLSGLLRSECSEEADTRARVKECVS